MQIKWAQERTPRLDSRAIHEGDVSEGMMFFELAVTGAVVKGGLGIARQCLGCYREKALAGEPGCTGFGPGCLGYRTASIKKPGRVADDQTYRKER